MDPKEEAQMRELIEDHADMWSSEEAIHPAISLPKRQSTPQLVWQFTPQLVSQNMSPLD